MKEKKIGRDVYHNFLLDDRLTDIGSFFIRSIRFSTHGEFYFRNININIEEFDHPHLHCFSEADELLSFYKIIHFEGDRFYFPSAVSCNNGLEKSGPLKLPLIPSQKNDVFSSDLLFVDFIVNPNSQIEFVCALNKNREPVHHQISFEACTSDCNIRNRSFTPGSVLTLILGQDKINELHINTYFKHWLSYRAIGINIPLLVIQVSLGRNVKTVPVFDSKLVSFKDDIPRYNMNQIKVIWFDLDETLVCRWRPIKQIVSFLNKLVENNCEVRLITRHTYDINETLWKIGINPSIFSLIIKVNNWQRKSEFVSSGELIIDNEFGERVDVRKNSNALVMDLDQIDFIA